MLVDPFIPATPRAQGAVRPPQALKPRRPARTLDGVPSPRPAPAFVHPRAPASRKPATPPAPAQPQRRPHQAAVKPRPAPKKQSRKRKVLGILGQIAFVSAAMALGFLVQSVIIGQAVVLIYGICAVIFRVASRITFLLALLSLGVVVISSVRSQTALASTFAVYVFLLLGVGTLTLARELRNEI